MPRRAGATAAIGLWQKAVNPEGVGAVPRAVLFVMIVAAGIGLAGCAGTSDPWDPAIQAMTAANSCGPAGSSDVNQCRGHPRHSD